MAASTSTFNRLLLILLAVLYVITLSVFVSGEWRANPDPQLWMMAVNVFILSIPLVLLYGSIYVLVRAGGEYRLTGQVSSSLAKVVYWAPRIAAILIIFFVSLFSLDVFGMDATPLQLLWAFLLHSIPSILLILLLVFAWRRPVIGFIAFLLAGLFFLRFVIPGGDLGNFLLFSGPLLLVSILFYADWRWHKPQPQAPVNHSV